MKPYPETIAIEQPKAQISRTKMSPVMELEIIIGSFAPVRGKIASNFIDYLRAMGMKSKTLRNYAYALRSLEVVDKGYKDFTKEDIISWIKHLELDNGRKPSTINIYKAYVKRFFKWLLNNDDCSDEYPAVVRWMKCKPPKPDNDRYIPSKAEILRMILAAECQRDRAAMFVLLESGARSGEFVRMRTKDVVLDKYGAMVRLNGKTGERHVRLVESVPDLQLWINMHPRKDDLDAPLWTTRDIPHEVISQMALDSMLRKYCNIAKTNGIFGAHKLRHAQATEDAKHYPEPVLRAKYGWTKDSDMPSVYVHHSARDTDSVILGHYGIKIEADLATMNQAMPKTCPRCNHSNSAMARYCMQCSAPLDVKAVMDIEAKTAQADDITAQVLTELMKIAPEMLAKILSEKGLQSKIVDVVKG